MTYSAECPTQVIKSIKQQDMSIRQVCAFYNFSKTTLQRWLKDRSIKAIRNKVPTIMSNEALSKDVEQYPNDYLYGRARPLNCSKSGVGYTLKRLHISKKRP